MEYCHRKSYTEDGIYKTSLLNDYDASGSQVKLSNRCENYNIGFFPKYSKETKLITIRKYIF